MAAAGVRRASVSRPRKSAPKKTAKRMPVSEARISKFAGIAFGLFVALIAAVVLVALDIPNRLLTSAGEAVGQAGFAVKRVDVVGIRNMDSAPVYQIALDQQSRAMPLVDVEEIRSRLLRYGWIKDARVSRRLPDTLVIDIVERKPAALWQDKRNLSLIDSEGVVLKHIPVTEMPDLPLLIGPGANLRERQLSRLIAVVPTLKPQLVSATWIGGRRWDLKFQSGETIALPEGDSAAVEALGKFAELDRKTGLLGRGIIRFDLRIPGKMIVRLPRAPAASIAAPPPVSG